MTDQRVEAALRDLAPHVAVPATRDLSLAVVRAVRESPMPRAPRTRRRVVAAVLAAAVLVVALPGPREAVADWIGLRTVHIVRVDTIPDDLGTTLQLGRAIPVDQLQSRPHPVNAPARFGPPTRAYVDEPAPGSVTLVWGAQDFLSPIRDTHVGALLTQVPGSYDDALIRKVLGHDTNLETVSIGNAPGYWISGTAHEFLYLAPDGRARTDTIRLAANTLLWSANGVTYRLESNLSKSDAIAAAEGLRPLR